MKFPTRLAAAGAAAIMALSLAGCDGGNMNYPSGSSAVITGDTIVIGSVTTNSGSAAAYGEAELQGFQLAVDEINAAGGVNGKRIALESMDKFVFKIKMPSGVRVQLINDLADIE